MGRINPKASFDKMGGGDGSPILFPSIPKPLEHFIPAI
jgi:hypothetical protein